MPSLYQWIFARATLSGNRVLLAKVRDIAEDVAVRRVQGGPTKVRRHGEVDYAAKSWPARPDVRARRVIARVEAGPQGTDSRFINWLAV